MEETGERPIDAADQQLQEPHDPNGEPETVPEVGDKTERLEQQVGQLIDQQDLLKRLLLRQQQQQPPAEEPDEEETTDPNEYVTNKTAKRYADRIDKLEREIKEKDRIARIRSDESAINSETGDYFKLIRKYAEHAYKEDPDLHDEVAMMAQIGKNAPAYLYKRVKQSKAYLADQKTERQSKAAQTVAKNAEKAPSLSQMGRAGNAAGDNYWKNMDSRDFQTYLNQVCSQA